MKKGQAGFGMSRIGWWLLFALALFGLIMFVLDFNAFASDKGKTQQCFLALLKGTSIADNCPVYEVDIGPESATRTEYDRKTKKKTTEKIIIGKDKDIPKQALLETMRECEERGPRGAFANDPLFVTRACMRCAEVKLQGVSISGFTEFLRDTPRPASDESYLDYFSQGEERKKAYLELGAIYQAIPASTEKQLTSSNDYSYTVVYYANKKSYVDHIKNKGIDLVTFDVINFLFNDDDQYFTYLIDSARINEVCDHTYT